MAGQRGRSGRKSDGEIARLRELIDRAVDEKTWVEIIGGLVKLAKTGDKGSAQAANILFSYRFGNPTTYIGTREGEQIQIKTIEILEPRERRPRKRKTDRRDASGSTAGV